MNVTFLITSFSLGLFHAVVQCKHAALRGKCIYNNCPKDHEATSKIDDAAVDLALSNLAPIFKHIDSKGKKALRDAVKGRKGFVLQA